MESVLLLILSLALIGFIVWAVVTYIPMPQIFKTVIIVVVCFVLLYWLIANYGGYLHLPAPGAKRG